ncbi:N-alpha-acetyltransferase 80 [Bufo gargarizans]|uniref:N-alpha-acetyltransferase 80 n=1 Tax=Bufo gargarizans TaxID=30331 RepID=UPI001CF38D9D|nr:N-alpha-acetyltransferase 80 [Bufo gargarizans]
MGESAGDGAATPGSVLLVPLHHHPDLTASCAKLLNQTWKRSLGARMHSLERSADEFPLCLVLVGAPEGPALGHARLCRVVGLQDSLFVESVVVSAELRGKGYGRKLMEATERYARGRGFQNLYLTTHDKQDFYHHLGYRLSEPVQNMGSLNSLLPATMIQKMVASKTNPTSNHHPVSSTAPPSSNCSMSPPPPPPPSSNCSMSPPPPPPSSSNCSMSPPPPPPPSSTCSMSPPPPPPPSSTCSMSPPPPPPSSTCCMSPPPPPPFSTCSMSPPPPPSSTCSMSPPPPPLPPPSSTCSMSPPPPPPPPLSGTCFMSPPPPPPPPLPTAMSPPSIPPADQGTFDLQTPYLDFRGNPIFWMKKCI